VEAVIEIEDMIGKPFKEGGRDLNTGVDCFGVLIECHRRLGKEITDFRSPKFHHEMEEALNNNKTAWTPHWEKSEAGVYAPLAICTPGRSLQLTIKGTACHVGFIYKPGWMVHAWEETNGVTAERIEFWKKRIVGVYEFNG
jgi:cell wall-associated NlpC family hydrolase